MKEFEWGGDGIDVSDWRNNTEELVRLNGSDGVIMYHPPSIGKTKMLDIAIKLSEVRYAAMKGG